MKTLISDYINVRDKYQVEKWDLKEDIAFIPSNLEFETNEYFYANSVKSLKTVFRNNDLNFDVIDSKEIAYQQLNSFEWIGPTLFFGVSMLSDNQHLISISLSVIASYLTDFFRGTSGDNKVKLDIVVEKEKNKIYKKIQFEGSVDSLKDLPRVIKAFK